jgi:16S rRNA processing protein RimM
MSLRKKALQTNSGSPPPGEPEYLLVGMLRRPHGVRGDVLMQVVTDFPERLQPGTEVLVGAAHRARVIASRRPHAQGIILRFEGTDSPEKAGVLRNQPVYISGTNRPPLPAGQYYHHELLGSEVIDGHGTSLGRLSEILQTGANDVYVVMTADQRELLLPGIASVIMQVDVASKTIKVNVPDGLVAESKPASSKRQDAGRKPNASRR